MVGFQMQPYRIQSMLKEGHKHLSGLDEAVLKNINACSSSSILQTHLIKFDSTRCNHHLSIRFRRSVALSAVIAAAMKSEPLKVIIYGAPASGKGTQCELITKKIRKLDDSEFQNAFSQAYIRVKEYESKRSSSRSRGRSRSYSRSRGRGRSLS